MRLLLPGHNGLLLLWLFVLPLTAPAAMATEISLPRDCLPGRIVSWEVTDPELRFGFGGLPGIVLGPPGDSTPVTGSTSVASLGNGGAVTIALTGTVIEDRPGPDFIVFENAFFVGVAPAAPEDDYFVFVEPGTVEVSADGEVWHLFPFDAAALTPTFAGNWTVPDDLMAWDPAGIGGVSGAGGDAFDLADLGLVVARFIRITDANTQNGVAGAAEGFDLDAIVALHARPADPFPGADADGDGLSDGAEEILYGSLPGLADSDGDGVDDGREVAGCRDPMTTDPDPWRIPEPRLWVIDADCAQVRWTFPGSGVTADLVRGDLFDMGQVACLADEALGVSWTCDAALPDAGQGFFYLVRTSGTGYGRSSDLIGRQMSGGCP